ncbi:G-protein coupled receptors family 1 profile domain-containing protein [Caenorhabditis elegans]|uniref:G-protein coupled receptors family 1 profile domain-containing protein n=1 Tax=Caenorhabditis elegans TaxID=6239 RepID=A0A0M7RFA1_CAEEL|nr:G-protein coupled receptors family 1 profile domain-containing protein [Caenorhabditis elegans]CUR30037.1 G-protein coupled receptors family 1 profile domain-containing protein [Caenorhabditis elegans]|eukprot:NP_001303738.1 Uncharacterized protein CELE_F54E2.9 [Caenorhabditis elegans]
MVRGFETPLDEDFGEIPESAKTGAFYFIISLFVLSTVITTLLTTVFTVLIMLLWGYFKPMKFFWFLAQLTISVFIISCANLLINVPATLSLISKDSVQSEIFSFISHLIDFCHYSILFSNLVIAIHRAFVFFLRHLTDTAFSFSIIYIWLMSVWVLALIVEIILITSNCKYRYENKSKIYQLRCEARGETKLVVNKSLPGGIQLIENIVQIGIPILIFVIYIAIISKIAYMKQSSLSSTEISILKQSIFVFVAFQASSVVFLFAQNFEITNVTAFLVKRFVNTMEILAGAATPTFFFLTSREIRKFVFTRVSPAGSQGTSNFQVRSARALD